MQKLLWHERARVCTFSRSCMVMHGHAHSCMPMHAHARTCTVKAHAHPFTPYLDGLTLFGKSFHISRLSNNYISNAENLHFDEVRKLSVYTEFMHIIFFILTSTEDFMETIL